MLHKAFRLKQYLTEFPIANNSTDKYYFFTFIHVHSTTEHSAAYLARHILQGVPIPLDVRSTNENCAGRQIRFARHSKVNTITQTTTPTTMCTINYEAICSSDILQTSSQKTRTQIHMHVVHTFSLFLVSYAILFKNFKLSNAFIELRWKTVPYWRYSRPYVRIYS